MKRIILSCLSLLMLFSMLTPWKTSAKSKIKLNKTSITMYTGTKVKLKNDAKCSALAEQKYGNFSECENGLFLCVGTGVGGAVIYNGKVLEAKEVPGFEFSHMIIQKLSLIQI